MWLGIKNICDEKKPDHNVTKLLYSGILRTGFNLEIPWQCKSSKNAKGISKTSGNLFTGFPN
jgi:hypothetical protein